MGTISCMQLQEQLSSKQLTMHRDATTKRGYHYYAVEYSNDDGETLTAGLRKVCDGKTETYVKSTKKILGGISQDCIDSIFNNTKCFMTDRSSTESKTNRLLETSKTDNKHLKTL